MHVRNGAYYRLNAHAGEPAQPSDQLIRLGAILADIEGERAGLLDLLVVPALGFAVGAQNIELVRQLRDRTQATGVGVACDQTQGLPLAVTGDHDRRMRPGEALRKVERTLEPVVRSFEGAFIATLTAPHPQADLDRLLEYLEALFERREGNSEAARLLFVMAGPDAEPGPPPREHVQGGYRLGQYARVSEVRPRHHGRELDIAGVGGQERQGRIALQFGGLRATHYRVLPNVVRHTDAIESCLLGGPRDPGQCWAEADCSSGPAKVVDLEPEFHRTMPPIFTVVTPPRRKEPATSRLAAAARNQPPGRR